MPGALSGMMADYVPWKKEWSWMIHSKVDAVLEVRKVLWVRPLSWMCLPEVPLQGRDLPTTTTPGPSLVTRLSRLLPSRRTSWASSSCTRSPPGRWLSVRHDVKLSCNACATTKNYEPVSQRKRPIFSGTWEAKKPSKEVEVLGEEAEEILEEISEVEDVLKVDAVVDTVFESSPVSMHDSVKEEKSKVTAEVRPAAGDSQGRNGR